MNDNVRGWVQHRRGATIKKPIEARSLHARVPNPHAARFRTCAVDPTQRPENACFPAARIAQLFSLRVCESASLRVCESASLRDREKPPEKVGRPCMVFEARIRAPSISAKQEVFAESRYFPDPREKNIRSKARRATHPATPLRP